MGEMVSHVQKFIPRQSGERKLVATFSSRELIDVIGSRPVLVRDWNVLLIKTSELYETWKEHLPLLQTPPSSLPSPLPSPLPLTFPAPQLHPRPHPHAHLPALSVPLTKIFWKSFLFSSLLTWSTLYYNRMCNPYSPLVLFLSRLWWRVHYFFFWLGDGFQSIEYSSTENYQFQQPQQKKHQKSNNKSAC